MAHACLVEGAACDRPSYSTGNYEDGARPAQLRGRRPPLDRGLATALVAALVTLVGVLIARGLFDVPVLAPTDEGTLGNASTLRLAVFAAVAALLATGLLHLLLLSTPQPRGSSPGSSPSPPSPPAGPLPHLRRPGREDRHLGDHPGGRPGHRLPSVGRRPQRHLHQPLGHPERGGGRGGEGGHGGNSRS